MVKYTFLMPAYKAMYLREAIESILSQSYKEFQLIVSDDCSPENLYAIVKEFDDERILYRCNNKNIGGNNLVEHWNLILGLANSEYVILSPDDDLYAPCFLEEIDKLTNKYPQVNVLKARVQKIDEDGDVIMTDRVYEEYLSQMDNLFHQALPDHMSGIGNYVFRTKALRENGGFVDYPLAWWSDVMTNVRLSVNGMAVTNKILFTMRMSGISITTRKRTLTESRKKAEASMKCYDDINQIISSYTSLSKCDIWKMKVLREYLIQWLTDDLILAAPTFSVKEAKTLIKKYPEFFMNKLNLWAFWKEVLFRKNDNQ